MFRLTVEQYHAMIRFGILTDDDPVELLEGLLAITPIGIRERLMSAWLSRSPRQPRRPIAV